MNYIELAKKLISFPSLTPESAGCVEYIGEMLKKLGFKTYIIKFGKGKEEVTNLYAIYENGGPNICFAGHIDVVPTGPLEKWKYPPFEPTIDEEKLFGRGAVDMKGAIAAMIVAAREFLLNCRPEEGSISFLITSDEEGPAKCGTKPMIQWLEDNNYKIDFCIIGEPTYKKSFGDVIQIGRRGSASFMLEIFGMQGHVAYDNFVNPNLIAVQILNDFAHLKLDDGIDLFVPSKLNITSIDVGNFATNIIPDKATIRFNIRYNTSHTAASLEKQCRKIIENHSSNFTLRLVEESPVPFISDLDDHYVQLFAKIVAEQVGQVPEFTTYGGASDGRFIRKMCQVLEFGLASSTAHQINEYLFLEDLQNLYGIYHNILLQCFSTHKADVSELADAPDLESDAARYGGSSPPIRTT